MKQMTNRERLVSALQNKPVDRLPWAPLIDPYFISSIYKQGFNYDIIETMRYIGNDIMERHVGDPIIKFNNVDIHTEVNGKKTRTYYETPVGSVYEEHICSGETIFKTNHQINNINDVKVMQYIVENTTFHSNEAFLIARNKYIGDDGLAIPSAKMCPIQESLQFLAGVENTVYMMADFPDEMNELFAVMHERNKKQYHILAQYDIPAIFSYEDTSTTVMSKNMYIDYAAPAIDDYADILHNSDKVFITHMCGKVKLLADEIQKGKMNGIDSLCPPTTGDFYCWEAREKWGGDKIIIGGIEPPSLARMTVSQTLETVVEIIERLSSHQGFILSTGDAVPYGTPIENMKAISLMLQQLGESSLTNIIDRTILNGVIKNAYKK